MTFKLLFISFLLMTNLTLFAQRTFKITPKIGVSANSVYDHVGGAKWTYKFSPILIGTEFSFSILDNLEFTPEFSYARKGAQSFKVNSIRNDDYIFDYLIIAPNFKWQPQTKWETKVLFGSYYGFSTYARARFSPNDAYFNYRQLSTFKSYDTGLTIGGSQKIKVGTVNLIIEPRFQFGLIRFSNTRHRSFQLMFGVEI
jgi:hypothetical protein